MRAHPSAAWPDVGIVRQHNEDGARGRRFVTLACPNEILQRALETFELGKALADGANPLARYRLDPRGCRCLYFTNAQHR